MKSSPSPKLPTSAFLALLIALSTVPAALGAAAADSGGAAETRDTQINLEPALADDGSFVGSDDVSGSVDMSEWTLVSDLAKGEPPRFEPIAEAAAITAGAWSALGGYSGNVGGGALNSSVRAIAISGSNIYVGGIFTGAAGNAAASLVARWDGTNWQALPGPGGAAPFPYGEVNAIVVAGTNVYVGGDFPSAGGDAQARDLAVWNGSTWSDVAGATSGNPAFDGQVYAIAQNGSNLYVGGYIINAAVFGSSNPNPGDMLLRWDGSWHWVGQRACCTDTGNGALQGTVLALLATPTGVIAGGFFTDAAGDTSIDYLGEYTIDTNGWTRVGNLTLNPGGYVRALAGTATNLYVGGDFNDANAITSADYLVHWNGTQWSAPGGSNGISAIQDRVYAIAVSGSNVYVGGNFLNAGGQTPQPTADRLAKWNGSAWSGLGSNGVNDGALQGGAEPPGFVRALGLSSNALFAGGSFTNAAAVPEADYIAAYGTGSTTNQKPDGRIKLGSGSYVGNNIYNTTGVNQTRSGSAVAGATITFTISIQNDGTQGGKFKVASTASGNVNYQVKYFRGTTEITSAVVAGTYVTGSVPVGNLFNITAKVKVLPAALVGSTTTRLITITSNANPTKIDAVKLIAKRK